MATKTTGVQTLTEQQPAPPVAPPAVGSDSNANKGENNGDENPNGDAPNAGANVNAPKADSKPKDQPKPPVVEKAPPVVEKAPTKSVTLSSGVVEELPIGKSEKEFYAVGLGVLASKKAQIYYKHKGKVKYDENERKEIQVEPEKIHKAKAAFWNAVMKDDKGKPIEPIELVAYEVEEDDVMVKYAFR